MSKLIVTAAACLLLAIPVPPVGAAEGCIAVNPGQATCSYTATSSSEGSATGIESWKVTVKHKGKTTTYTPAGGYYGEPTVQTVIIHKGDKVTAKALETGSTVVVTDS